MKQSDTLYARMLSGDLEPSEIQSLKESGEWDELEVIIKASEHIKLSDYDNKAELERLMKTNKSKTAKVLNLGNVWRYGAAASLVIIVGALFFFQNRSTTITSDFANTETHQFVDNSIVTLNDGSSINYSKNDWDSNRNVDLKGEAYFEVEKGHPFIVSTNSGTIEVLGTSFNIKAWQEDLYVECYSGKVQVHANGESIILTKGKAVKIVNKQERVFQDFIQKRPHWLDGISTFEQESLNHVFDELERQYNIKVKFKETKRPFSGSFVHSSLEDALHQICKPMKLKYEIDSNKKAVSITEE